VKSPGWTNGLLPMVSRRPFRRQAIDTLSSPFPFIMCARSQANDQRQSLTLRLSIFVPSGPESLAHTAHYLQHPATHSELQQGLTIQRDTLSSVMGMLGSRQQLVRVEAVSHQQGSDSTGPSSPPPIAAGPAQMMPSQERASEAIGSGAPGARSRKFLRNWIRLPPGLPGQGTIPGDWADGIGDRSERPTPDRR
jgi:hypothetical protein